MVGFAVALAKVTLQPSAASVDLTHTNFRPGDSIRMYLAQPAFRDTVKQIGGNLLLGVPFGVLLPVLIPRARGALRVTVVTATVMLLVEVAQGALVEGRAFDIDDVILNTAGALIGYLLLGRRMGRALHPRRHHWWQRSGGPAGARPASRKPPAGKAPAGKAPARKAAAGKASARKAAAGKPAGGRTRSAKASAGKTGKKRAATGRQPASGAWWQSFRRARR